MFQAWKNAWKFFPGAAVLGGMIAVSTPVESEVMPSISGMMAGTAVGLSTVLFQKTMEILNQFGVKPMLLAAQVVNFFILLFIFYITWHS